MAGVPGRSGTNKGKDKPFRDALRMQIAAAGDDGKKLRDIADKLLALAEGGDLQAIKEVADRTDGKPAQAIVGGDDDDPALQLHHTITRRIVGPGDTNGSGSPAAA